MWVLASYSSIPKSVENKKASSSDTEYTMAALALKIHKVYIFL